MKEPTQCVLWRKPKRSRGPIEERFEILDTFVDESHHSRRLLKCRECGQRYFYEFNEEIDWEGGKDPQFKTYIPVESDAEIEMLKQRSPYDLLDFRPRLQSDWPRDAKHPLLHWVR